MAESCRVLLGFLIVLEFLGSSLASVAGNAWLSGKVAVVTGAASGIGFSLARRCLDGGCKVVLSDGNPEMLERAAKELGLGGGDAKRELLSVVADVRKRQDITALLSKCMERFGRVDLMFSNAGVIGEPDKGVQTTSEESWRWVLDTNVMGLVNCIQVFLPQMESQKGECHMIATASGAGIYSQHRSTMAPYVASKHCAVIVAQALKTELDERSSNVKAHVICPSVVATPLIKTSRWYIGKEGEEMDQVSKNFDDRLNSDGMTPDRVAELTLQGIKQGNFFVITHPKVTKERVEARAQELLAAIAVQPETGF